MAVTQLEQYFHVINSRYFRNRLKNVKVTWKRVGLSDEKVLGRTLSASGPVPKGQRKFHIQISSELRKHQTLTLLTLFHELVHVEQWDKITAKTAHGHKFNKRMKQLAQQGAFNGLW